MGVLTRTCTCLLMILIMDSYIIESICPVWIKTKANKTIDHVLYTCFCFFPIYTKQSLIISQNKNKKKLNQVSSWTVDPWPLATPHRLSLLLGGLFALLQFYTPNDHDLWKKNVRCIFLSFILRFCLDLMRNSNLSLFQTLQNIINLQFLFLLNPYNVSPKFLLKKM